MVPTTGNGFAMALRPSRVVKTCFNFMSRIVVVEEIEIAQWGSAMRRIVRVSGITGKKYII
jgi:hypothetical protein